MIIFNLCTDNIRLLKKINLYFVVCTFLGWLITYLDYVNLTFFWQNQLIYSWIPFLNFTFYFAFDQMSLLFILLSSFLIIIVMMTSWDNLETHQIKFYFTNILLIHFLLILVFSALDLLVFYILFEAILIPMFLMIVNWGSRERKIRAAYLLFYYTLITALLMLIGIIYIYTQVNSTNYFDILNYQFSINEQFYLWWLFFFVFASKIPMIPMHIWLPEAHVEAPTAGSILLAGILLKFGSYGFIRYSLTLFPYMSKMMTPFIFTLSLIGIIYASLSAIRQTDMKRIIAYSSIAHMNLIVLGIFSFNTLGLIGSIFQSLSHGFVSSALFFLIGTLYDRYHSRIVHYFGGIVQLMPVFTSFFIFFTMANIGFPGTSNFLGELALLAGIIKNNFFITFFATTGMILGGLYSLWASNRMAFGNLKFYLEFSSDLTLKEQIILFMLAFLTLWFGLSPITLDCYFYNKQLIDAIIF